MQTFRILPAAEREGLLALVTPALDIVYGLGAFFKPSYLAGRGWRAGIFGADFRDADGCVSTPLRERGLRELACGTLTEYVLDSFRIDCDHASLKRVHDEYVEPSYFVTDDLRSFCLVSDSDYYWGIAGDADLVDRVSAGAHRTLDEFEASHAPYLDSDDAHDRRIGAMLAAHLAVCRASR